jgi:hypothetical protein
MPTRSHKAVRRRGGLNRIGLLAIVLLIALGTLGVAYGAWVDEIYITGSLSTSSINTGLACGECYFVGETTEETDIDCEAGSTAMTLDIEVANAQEGLDYYCGFTVSNATGSLPIKIESMSLTGSYSGVVEAIEDLPAGTVIDPGLSDTGEVHIHLNTAASAGADLYYTLTVTVERWNE